MQNKIDAWKETGYNNKILPTIIRDYLHYQSNKVLTRRPYRFNGNKAFQTHVIFVLYSVIQ